MAGIKALVIRPFDGTLSLPVDFQTTHPLGLDYPRGEDEPIGGGFVAVVGGLFGYGVAIVRTGAEQLQSLADDQDTLAVLVLTEPEGGTKWPELNDPVTNEGLARVNAILTANGAANLPQGISLRQALGVMAPGVKFSDFDLG